MYCKFKIFCYSVHILRLILLRLTYSVHHTIFNIDINYNNNKTNQVPHLLTSDTQLTAKIMWQKGGNIIRASFQL